MTAGRWELVFGLFDAAIAREETERGEFLAHECRDDAQLRDDVQSLIAAHLNADGFLSAHQSCIGSAESGRPQPAVPMLEPDARIGVFVVQTFIGAGGMGEVYLARDTRLDRLVAIKVLSPNSAGPRSRARFAYEARAIARLSHSRICALHDIGHHAGIDFLVMEYLQGETLAARLRRGPLPLAETIRTGLEIGEALAAAHTQGVVHCDLKPANVMLTEGGAKLLDFGLARLRAIDQANATVPEGAQIDTRLTLRGVLAGTLPYMAPEQLRNEEVDQRTDVFAFGSVLYEMVTGSRPFSADSPAGLVAAILEHDPKTMAARQPLTPPALNALVEKCLAKEPRQRWQRAEDIVVALTSISEEQVAGASDRAAVKGRRTGLGRAGVFAGVLALAALAAVSGLAWLSLDRSPSRVALAVLPFENLGGGIERQYVADGLTEETTASLGQVDPGRLSVIGRTSTLRYKATTKSIAEIGQELGVDYVVESSIRADGDRLRVTAELIRVQDQMQVWSQSYERSLTNLLGLEQELSTAVAEQIRLRLSPERQAAIARRQSSNAAAYDLFLHGRSLWNQLTPPTTQRAIEYYTRAIALDPMYALAWSGMADAFTAGPINGDAPPQQVSTRARDAVAHAIAADSNLAEAQASQGAFRFWLDWNWPAAEASLRRAIALDPNYPFEHLLLGMVLSHSGRHAEAASAIRRARELDPLSAPYQALSAQVAFNARDYQAAVEFGRQATVIDPQFWVGFYQLGQAYGQIGKTELALEATANAERFSGGGNSSALSLRGYLLAQAGKVNEARDVLAALQTASRNRYMPPYATALVHAGLGDREAVFEWLAKAFAAHDVHLAFLPVDARWDAYRADPRFSALVERCGFSGAAQSRSLTEGQ